MGLVLIQRSGLHRAIVNFCYIRFEKAVFELFLILTKNGEKKKLSSVCLGLCEWKTVHEQKLFRSTELQYLVLHNLTGWP